MLFFFNDTATTEIYTLSLHDALPICRQVPSHVDAQQVAVAAPARLDADVWKLRRRVDRQNAELLLAARRAQDAPKLPLPVAQRAHQRSPRPLVLLSKHGHHGSAPAARTQYDRVGDRSHRFGADSPGVRCQECPGEELIVRASAACPVSMYDGLPAHRSGRGSPDDEFFARAF